MGGENETRNRNNIRGIGGAYDSIAAASQEYDYSGSNRFLFALVCVVLVYIFGFLNNPKAIQLVSEGTNGI